MGTILTDTLRAALCQVYDSIFLDLPMARVKFNAHTEYAYLENFKILSNAFRKHNVDRPIPVEQLVKCKMQDNLEFLQWSKRYWDQHFPGGDYDPVARRKGVGAGATPTMGPTARTATAPRRPAGPTAPRTSSRQTGIAGAGAGQLQRENAELKEHVIGLERERDFYFSKLRDIELLIQEAIEQEPAIDEDDNHILKRIQTILYSTEVCALLTGIRSGFKAHTDAKSYRKGLRFHRKSRAKKQLVRRKRSEPRGRDQITIPMIKSNVTAVYDSRPLHTRVRGRRKKIPWHSNVATQRSIQRFAWFVSPESVSHAYESQWPDLTNLIPRRSMQPSNMYCSIAFKHAEVVRCPTLTFGRCVPNRLLNCIA